MFSRKSPNVIKISPRWRIFSILFLISIPCLTSLIFTTSPLRRRTIGVSILSTNATVAPFPGRSHLTCVPTAIVWSKISATTGWNPTAANPVLHALPYLSLNPPNLLGIDNTDLPVITSRILFAAASSWLSPVWTAPLRSPSHSQPSKLYISILLSNFFDLPIKPSLRTRKAPPLTLSVWIRVIPLWFTTSYGSVSTPANSTGRFEITCSISSSKIWNWKLLASLS